MLPLTLEKRIENPGLFEKQFVDYLIAGNWNVDTSKSIAYEVLTDYRNVTTRTNAQFFTGQFVQAQTNIRGSYVRPQGEHFVIYGIRVYTQVGFEGVFNPAFVTWKKGAYTTSNFNSNVIDTAFSNASYTIVNNGVTELKNMPLLQHDNTLVDGTRGTLWLNQPIVWAGQTELSLSVTTNGPNNAFPGTLSAGEENNSLLRFDLIGIGLI